MAEKNSYDYIADAVRAYWKNTYPQDVVVFFWQKYSHEDDWEYHEVVTFCDSDSDYETVSFLNDFCEGQTCVKDITVVPLSEVTEYYASTKLNPELWKEQEAVPVIQREIMHMLIWCCGSCGVAITEGDKFCRMCGKRLKWK